MANLVETNQYDAGIYQIETVDPVIGGASGIANLQAKQLANRTMYLKGVIDAIMAGTSVPTGLATVAAVQAMLDLLDHKQSVRVATTANIALTGLQTIDGVAVIAGDRVLVKDQTTASQNGIYVASASGWSRASDASISAEVTPGIVMFIEEGTLQGNSRWQLVTDAPITLGTTSLTFQDVMQGYAKLASAALTGTPTAPTAAAGTNNTQISTTGFAVALLQSYGIGGAAAAIPGVAAASIDDVTLAGGLYYVTSTNTGTKPSGDDGFGHMLVSREGTSTTAHQLYMDNTTAKIWSRNYSPSAWTAWREVAFVDSVKGRSIKSVAGGANVTLTATETDAGIISLTGALTANITVFFPAVSGVWWIENYTSGAYTVTLKTSAGTVSVPVTQGKILQVCCNGTDVLKATDFIDTALLGSPTAPTPAQFDSTTHVATMAALQRALGSFRAASVLSANTTLTAADVGGAYSVNGYTVTLPVGSGLAAGSAFTFLGAAAGNTLARQGTDAIYTSGSSVTSISFGNGDTLAVTWNGTSWIVTSGSATLGASPLFGSSLATSGYQKLPGGLIMQWGLSTATVAGTANTFPIAFPNAAFQILHSEANGNTALTSLSTTAPSTTGFTAYAATGPVSTAYVAFGK